MDAVDEAVTTEEPEVDSEGTALEPGDVVITGDETPKESEGRVPNLVIGERVRVKSGEFADRMAYVMRIEYASTADALQAGLHDHPERPFAEVSQYIVKSRDARTDVFSVKPEEVEPLDERNGWGRGRV